MRSSRAAAAEVSKVRTSSEFRTKAAARSTSKSLQSSPRGSEGNHGSVATVRPIIPACRAVMPVPLRRLASTTSTTSDSAAIRRLRFSKCHLRIGVPLLYSEMRQPPCRMTSTLRSAQSDGYGQSNDVGSTTAVGRDSKIAIRWANSSIPRAPPLTTSAIFESSGKCLLSHDSAITLESREPTIPRTGSESKSRAP